jgi:hypothetical protein
MSYSVKYSKAEIETSKSTTTKALTWSANIIKVEDDDFVFFINFAVCFKIVIFYEQDSLKLFDKAFDIWHTSLF